MIKVLLPQFGMGMQDGKITRWFKSVGDRVAQGELLCEVESSKTVVEMESPASGILSQILVGVDEEAQIQDVLAVIQEEDVVAPSTVLEIQRSKIETVSQSLQHDANRDSRQTTTQPRGQEQVEPRARRLAHSNNVDLSLIPGTGPGGRITEDDVARAIAATPGSPRTSEFEDVPVSNVRRVIAERLVKAKQTVPHFYLTTRCRVDALLSLRRRVNETAIDGKISLNDFIIKAVSLALMARPNANVTWEETAIRKYHRADIAVAVATPRGLITPIIRSADTKSVSEISKEMRLLTRRARDGELQPDEYTGGSFTISNLGMYGVQDFSAIINPPHAGILAVGAAKLVPIVSDGVIVPATIMSCTLSVDHRAVDGAVAAQFLGAFTEIIEAQTSHDTAASFA
jgi:pyruvate dehydrogenase E2 component (dihydrolipoamide acetyltransferase)